MPSIYNAQIKHAQHYKSIVQKQSQKDADYTWIYQEINQLEHVRLQIGDLSILNKEYTTEIAQLFIGITEEVSLALHNYGRRNQALEWCDQALLLASHFQHNPARLLIAKARLEASLGNIAGATDSLQQAVRVSSRMDLEHAQSLLGLVSIELGQGEYNDVLRKLQSISSLLEEQGNSKYIIFVEYQIAMYHLKSGNFVESLAIFLQLEGKIDQNPELSSLYPGTEITEMQYMVWLQIGCIYRKLAVTGIKKRYHNYKIAEEYLEKLNIQSKDRFHPEMEASSAHHLGWIYLNRGELTKALNSAIEAQRIYERLDRITGMADVYEQLGLVYIAKHQPEIGLSWMEKSLQLREQIKNRHGAASSMRRIAIAQFHLKQWRYALNSLVKSIEIYHDIGVFGIKRFIGILLEILDWTMGRRRFTL